MQPWLHARGMWLDSSFSAGAHEKVVGVGVGETEGVGKAHRPFLIHGLQFEQVVRDTAAVVRQKTVWADSVFRRTVSFVVSLALQ